MIAAVLYLAFADAYDFYSAAVAKKAVRHTGRAGNVFTYLMRYLMANKSYLINTAGLCGIACFLPLLFGEFQGLNMFPIGLAILCSKHPNLYAAVLRPGFGAGNPYASRTGGAILSEVLLVYLCGQQHCRQHLPLQLADGQAAALILSMWGHFLYSPCKAPFCRLFWNGNTRSVVGKQKAICGIIPANILFR